MKSAASILTLALTLLPFAGAAQAANPKTDATVRTATAKALQWVALEDGVKQAAASGQYIFVAVYTDWCTYCRRLNNVTFKAQPVLDELGKNFQSVRINAESPKPVVWQGKKMSERDVAGKEWGVTGYPTMLFLSPEGEIIGTYSAYADPELMVQLLTYVSSGARERKVSFEDFVEGEG